MIGVTRDGHVMTLEMQRAERRNALNGELVDGLREAVEKAAAEDIRAIVLTGQGTVFCPGADLSDAAVSPTTARQGQGAEHRHRQGADAGDRRDQRPGDRRRRHLAMICDLRVVAPEAFFQFPDREIRPGAG